MEKNKQRNQELFAGKLEQAIAAFCAEQNYDTNFNILQTIVEGVMNNVEVLAAAGFPDMPDPKELKVGMELSGLQFLKLKLGDKSFFAVYTNEKKTAEFPCPSMMRCTLYQVLVNVKHTEGLYGVVINPGKENYVLARAAVIRLLEYVYENRCID